MQRHDFGVDFRGEESRLEASPELDPVTSRRLVPAPIVGIVRETVMDTEPWMARGACQHLEPDVFFPVVPVAGHMRYEREAIYERLVSEAVSVCRVCSVRVECGAYALREVIVDGIWGGMDERELRKRLSRRLSRTGYRDSGLQEGRSPTGTESQHER